MTTSQFDLWTGDRATGAPPALSLPAIAPASPPGEWIITQFRDPRTSPALRAQLLLGLADEVATRRPQAPPPVSLPTFDEAEGVVARLRPWLVQSVLAFGIPSDAVREQHRAIAIGPLPPSLPYLVALGLITDPRASTETLLAISQVAVGCQTLLSRLAGHPRASKRLFRTMATQALLGTRRPCIDERPVVPDGLLRRPAAVADPEVRTLLLSHPLLSASQIAHIPGGITPDEYRDLVRHIAQHAPDRLCAFWRGVPGHGPETLHLDDWSLIPLSLRPAPWGHASTVPGLPECCVIDLGGSTADG